MGTGERLLSAARGDDPGQERKNIYTVSIYPKQRPRPGGKLPFPPTSHLPTHPNFIKVEKISFDFL